MNKKFKAALVAIPAAVGLTLMAPAPSVAVPEPQGLLCVVRGRCGTVTNLSTSKANLLIYGDNGVQYLLKPGQKSTTRRKDTNRYFIATGCLHEDYRVWHYKGWHNGGGWHTLEDIDNDATVFLGLGCPARGY